MRTIAIVNQKGGCGKTTVSINLANALAELGKKTLLVDMDPQSHCAVGLAVPEDQIEQSIYDVLISKSRNEPIRLSEILWQINDNLELAPSTIDLSAFEQQMSGIADRECCLSEVLAENKGGFDFTIIDCPPAVSLLTFNALRAASDVIVPVETGYFSLHGLSKQLETLNILCERCQQQVSVRVLASMYDIRTKMAREILSELKTLFSDKMFRSIINFNTKVKEASSFGQPIGEYDPASKGQLDFRMLAKEVIESQVKEQRYQMVNSLAGQLESISSSADELLQTVTSEINQVAAPEIKEVEIPEINTPEIKEVVAPEIKDVEMPEIKDVEMPEIKEAVTPEIKEFEMPEINKPEIKDVEMPKANEPEPEPEPELVPAGATTNEKLSDYYGVNTVGDAIAFVTLYPRAQSVQIAGDFNNWQPETTPMEKIGSSGVWQAKIKLPAGKHRYRLVVDGQWQQDPYNEAVEMNPFGEYNSVAELKK